MTPKMENQMDKRQITWKLVSFGGLSIVASIVLLDSLSHFGAGYLNRPQQDIGNYLGPYSTHCRCLP